MHQLPQIKAAYDWFFARWQAEANGALSSGNNALLNRLEEKRDTLERSVFILMFGQFEIAVKTKFARARDLRSADPIWTNRRGWDSDNLKTKRVPFEMMLSLVMDKHSPSYRKVLDTYNIRNHCAHGGTTRPVGSIDALETDLYQWQSALKD